MVEIPNMIFVIGQKIIAKLCEGVTLDKDELSQLKEILKGMND